MKKLIAILVIAIVMIGVVFADDTAGLTVSVVVPEYVPTFKLGTSDTTNVNTQFYDAVVTESSVSYTSGSLNDTAAATLADANNDLVVTFGIFQVKPANSTYIKTENKYSFTATATNLILNFEDENNNNTLTRKTNPTSQERFEMSSVSLIKGVSTKPGTDYATVTDGASGVDFSIKYLGVSYTPASNDVEIGSFTVTWGKNGTALPGTYSADITLTMTTN